MYKKSFSLLLFFPFFFQISGMEKESHFCLDQLHEDHRSIIVWHSNLQSIARLKQTSKLYNTINIDKCLKDTTSFAYCQLGEDEKYDACTQALKHYEKGYYINSTHAQIFKNLLKHCPERRKKETQELIKSHTWVLSRRAPSSPYELWIKMINENNENNV